MTFLWTTLEPCLCIINANLPMTRTFLTLVAPSVSGSPLHQSTTGRSEITTIESARAQNSGKKAQFEVIEFDERFGYLKKAGIDVEMNRLGTENNISGGTGGKHGRHVSSSLSCI
jgi:hypothetical protein